MNSNALNKELFVVSTFLFKKKLFLTENLLIGNFLILRALVRFYNL